jgi:hypothetical protein
MCHQYYQYFYNMKQQQAGGRAVADQIPKYCNLDFS